LDQIRLEPGVEPDIITYTCAMRACARGKQTRKALTLLDTVREKGLILDVYVYTSVIDACAKGGMWERALELLDEMRAEGIMPNSITYGAAIAACGNGGEWERALQLLHQMRAKKMGMNIVTYNAAIVALARASRDKMKNIVKADHIKRYNEHVTAENSSLIDLIDESDNACQLWKKALDLLNKMKEDRIAPDVISYSAAINACGSGGRWKEAVQLIQTMKQGGPRVRPNKIAYTAAITACGRSGEWEEALRLYTDMKNAAVLPDRITYNAVLLALKNGNQYNKTIEIWDEMCGKLAKANPDLITTVTPTSQSIAPDIISLTEVLGTLDIHKHRDIIDQVMSEAVERDIILRSDSLDSVWEIDLSGMSFPVARGVLMYVMNRAHKAVSGGIEPEAQDISLITGVGKGQRNYGKALDNMKQNKNCEKGEDFMYPSILREVPFATTALREFVQECLIQDFKPPLQSTIPELSEGTVVIKRDILRKWFLEKE